MRPMRVRGDQAAPRLSVSLARQYAPMRKPTPNDEATPWLLRCSGAADCGASGCTPSALNCCPVSSSEAPTDQRSPSCFDTVGATVSCLIVVMLRPVPQAAFARCTAPPGDGHGVLSAGK
ncbi:hypothetical protein D3C86_1044900 [compost metagenome]